MRTFKIEIPKAHRKVKSLDKKDKELDLLGFYVYMHTTNDNKVFYIGKGKGERAYSVQNRNSYWHRTVNKYGCNITILHSNLTEEEAYKLEREEIQKYGLKRDGGDLVNLTPGGEGSAGYKWTEEQRENLRPKRAGENNPMYGKQLFGHKNPNYGNTGIHNPLSKSVIQLTFNGEFVRRFNSLSEVEKYGFKSSGVGLCCTGKRLQYRGFIFIYEEEYNVNNPPKYVKGKTSKRPVIGIDEINKTYKIYESGVEVSKDGFSSKVVNKCCNGLGKSYRGIKWFFYDEIKGDDLLRYSLVTSES